MTLQCALYQETFAETSVDCAGAITDEKLLRIQAKKDAQAKVKQFLTPYLLDDCPPGCDLVNDAQLPRAFIFNREWSRTRTGQTVAVNVTYRFYVIYECGNN